MHKNEIRINRLILLSWLGACIRYLLGDSGLNGVQISVYGERARSTRFVLTNKQLASLKINTCTKALVYGWGFTNIQSCLC